MAILVDWQLANRCRNGLVTPHDPDLVNPASVDLRLGDTLLIESVESPDLKTYPLSQHSQEDPYWLRPGQFVRVLLGGATWVNAIELWTRNTRQVELSTMIGLYKLQ